MASIPLYITNLTRKSLSLDVQFDDDRVLRELLSAGEKVDISSLATIDEVNRNGALSALIEDKKISVTRGDARKDAVAMVGLGELTAGQMDEAYKDGLPWTPSMRTLGDEPFQACSGADSRLSDPRTPKGTAGGDLSGTYPSPSVRAGALTDAHISADHVDGEACAPGMRSLGTSSNQACAGDDPRLSNTRTPSGAASGDLEGTYPAPAIKAELKDGSAVEACMRSLGDGLTQACSGADARLSDARVPTGTASGDLDGAYPSPSVRAGVLTSVHMHEDHVDGAATDASLRTLGTQATQACSGADARLSDARTPGGVAGGDLEGTYPNPEVRADLKDGPQGVACMRSLGTDLQSACSGADARLSDARTPTGAAGGCLTGTYPNPELGEIAGELCHTGTELGFYGAGCITQPEVSVEYTDLTGGVTTGTDLAAVAGTPDDQTINDNLAKLSARCDELTAILRALGLAS